LKYNPFTGQIWALQNQDGNSTLTLIDPVTHDMTGPLSFANPSATRGYDELIGMFNRTGRFNPEALAVLSRSFVEMGMLAQEPDIKTLITEEFLPAVK